MLISDHNDAFFYTSFGPFKIILVHMRRVNQLQGGGGGGGGERTLRKRTCTPTSRTWFVSPVIVRLMNWAARLRRRVHCLGVGSCQSDIAALKVVLIHFITCCVMLHQSLL